MGISATPVLVITATLALATTATTDARRGSPRPPLRRKLTHGYCTEATEATVTTPHPTPTSEDAGTTWEVWCHVREDSYFLTLTGQIAILKVKEIFIVKKKRVKKKVKLEKKKKKKKKR